MSSDLPFSSAVRGWFEAHFSAPTPIQAQSWPLIAEGKSVLLAAPTGSGKTLAAFLAVIDRQVRACESGSSPSGLRAIYVTPLRALSNDIALNLEAPLAAVNQRLLESGPGRLPLTMAVRTGDTLASARRRFLGAPTQFLVTTPESLFILLGSRRGREALRTVETVVVDEIHALVDELRGAHLALTLERLDRLAGRCVQRIGLSATLEPPQLLAQWIRGGGAPVSVVDTRADRPLELAIETPTTSLLSSVTSDAQLDQILDRAAALISAHRSTIVFATTRRMAERLAFRLAERLGQDQVSAHHGSMAPAERKDVERRLKAGELKAVVATASLELGIDVGAVDLVLQVGAPHRISTLIQRAGRACHQVGGRPKAILFPLTRDDLLECAAAVQSVARGRLENARPRETPLDVLAQQIVAELAHGALSFGDLAQLVRAAWAFRTIRDEAIVSVLSALEAGLETSAAGAARGSSGIAIATSSRPGPARNARP